MNRFKIVFVIGIISLSFLSQGQDTKSEILAKYFDKVIITTAKYLWFDTREDTVQKDKNLDKLQSPLDEDLINAWFTMEGNKIFLNKLLSKKKSVISYENNKILKSLVDEDILATLKNNKETYKQLCTDLEELVKKSLDELNLIVVQPPVSVSSTPLQVNTKQSDNITTFGFDSPPNNLFLGDGITKLNVKIIPLNPTPFPKITAKVTEGNSLSIPPNQTIRKNFKVTINKEGRSTIKLTANFEDGSIKESTVEIQVKKKSESGANNEGSEGSISAIYISNENDLQKMEIYPEKEFYIEVGYKPEDAKEKEFTIEVSDPSILVELPNNKFIFRKAGEGTITIKSKAKPELSAIIKLNCIAKKSIEERDIELTQLLRPPIKDINELEKLLKQMPESAKALQTQNKLDSYKDNLKNGDDNFAKDEFVLALRYYKYARKQLPTDYVIGKIKETSQIINSIRANPKRINYIFLIACLLLTGGLVLLVLKSKKELSQKEHKMQKLIADFENSQSGLSEQMKGNVNTLHEQMNKLEIELSTKNKEINELKQSTVIAGSPVNQSTHDDRPITPPPLAIKYATFPETPEGFLISSLKDTEDSRTIYIINPQNDNSATFRISGNTDAQKRALEATYKLLEPACEYSNSPSEGNSIITVREGKLIKAGNIWRITEKTFVRFG